MGIGVRKVVLKSLEEGWEEKVGRKTPMALFLNLPKLWADTWVDESHGGGEGRKGEERKAKTLYLTYFTHSLWSASPLLSSFYFPLPIFLTHTHTL